jgi:hypothetical protein
MHVPSPYGHRCVRPAVSQAAGATRSAESSLSSSMSLSHDYSGKQHAFKRTCSPVGRSSYFQRALSQAPCPVGPHTNRTLSVISTTPAFRKFPSRLNYLNFQLQHPRLNAVGVGLIENTTLSLFTISRLFWKATRV